MRDLLLIVVFILGYEFCDLGYRRCTKCADLEIKLIKANNRIGKANRMLNDSNIIIIGNE